MSKYFSKKIFYILLLLNLVIYSNVKSQPLTAGAVATSDSLATKIALNILNRGGNAIDAGVSAMCALTVVEPYSSSPGGGGLMIVKMNNTKAKMIDFREQVVLNADPENFYQSEIDFNIYSSSGLTSICVPGFFAGAEKALQEYGTMKLKEVLEPVIQLADSGFSVSLSLSKMTAKYYDHLNIDKITTEIYFPDWIPIPQGEIMRRPLLADAYRIFSDQGAGFFYEGNVGDRIIKLMLSGNGLMRSPDLSTYQVYCKDVLETNYRDYQVLTAAYPSIGGIALIELLKIIEKFETANFEQNEGALIHLFAEAMKQVDFNIDLSGEETSFEAHLNKLSDDYILNKIQNIDSTKSFQYQSKELMCRESRNAANVCILDRQGNTVLISQTLNQFFGSGVTLPDYGILFNNTMNSFSGDISSSNSIKPGKRALTFIAPVIILKDGEPFFVIGSSGGKRLVSTLAQLIIKVIDLKMSLPQAVLSPRFNFNVEENVVEMESRIDSETIEYLKKLGHNVKLFSDYDVRFGSVQALLINNVEQKINSLSDVRKEGIVYLK